MILLPHLLPVGIFIASSFPPFSSLSSCLPSSLSCRDRTQAPKCARQELPFLPAASAPLFISHSLQISVSFSQALGLGATNWPLPNLDWFFFFSLFILDRRKIFYQTLICCHMSPLDFLIVHNNTEDWIICKACWVGATSWLPLCGYVMIPLHGK